MIVHFHGGARTTTGSMYLLEVKGQKFLLECGLFQGRRDEMLERNQKFPFDPREIQCVLLSHAHIDHTGNLPNLVRQGFTGNIYCTFATRDLASLMLADSAEVQRADAEFVSRRRAKKGLPPIEPLYSIADAERTIRQFVSINYDRQFPVLDGVNVTFVDAGHILGSAQVVIDVREDGRRFRYLFSGDVGRPNQDILRDPVAVDGVDYLQVESTYGDREHEDTANARETLCKLIMGALARGGKVIIPAFAVGRVQQVVYVLNQLTDDGCLPRIPIFVDSPLSVSVTEVFRLHPECFDEGTYRYLHTKRNPFGMENLTYIREAEHSKKLNDLKEPAIIISASGMAEAGRIRHHLANNIGDSKNLILFVGYCAAHTLGAQILSGAGIVNIFGEPHMVNAQVARVDAFSAHAGRSELAGYVRRIQGSLKRMMVVHGDEAPAMAFAEMLRKEHPQSEVVVPERGESLIF